MQTRARVPSGPMTEIERSRFWSAPSAPGECSQRGSSHSRDDHSHTIAGFDHPRRRARQLQQVSHDGQAGRMNRSWFSRFEQVQRLLRSKLSTARLLCTSLTQEVAAIRISRRPVWRCPTAAARRKPVASLRCAPSRQAARSGRYLDRGALPAAKEGEERKRGAPATDRRRF